MQITEALLLPAQDHCTVTWVLHPGAEAWYYLSVRHESTRLRETGSCIGLDVPSMWPPSLVYRITPSASSDALKHQRLELESQPKSEDKGVDISLAEFTETILNDSAVQVTPIVGSDGTKGRVQTPLEKGGFIIPTAESMHEGELRLTLSYEKRKDRETNQHQVSKEILSETVDEEAQMISLEVQKAM